MTPLKQACLIVAFFFVCIVTGCRKLDAPATGTPTSALTERFLSLPAGAAAEAHRIADRIRAIDRQVPGFVPAIAANNGFAVWDKIMIRPGTSAAGRLGEAGTAADTVVYIPLVAAKGNHVNAFIYARLNGSISLQLYRAGDYARYGYGSISTSTGNAERLALQMMLLDNLVFGHTRFRLLDDSLFRSAAPHHANITRVGRILQIRQPDSTASRGTGHRSAGYWQAGTVTHCTYTTAYHCTGDLVCQPNCDNCELCITAGYNCETTVEYYFVPGDDDWGTGNGGSVSGGGGNVGSIPVGGIPCNPTPQIDNGLLPCPAGNTTGWIPFVPAELEEIDDTQVTDSCLRALIEEIGKPGLSSTLLMLYDESRHITSEKQLYRVKYTMDTSLTGNNGQPVPGRTYVEKLANGTNQVNTTLNPNFFQHTSKEWVTAVILHELTHGVLIVKHPGDTTNYLSHKFMFENLWPKQIGWSLQELYPSITRQDAIALGMDGLADIYTIKLPNGTDSIDIDRDKFAFDYYEQNIIRAIHAAAGFMRGVKGTSFCH